MPKSKGDIWNYFVTVKSDKESHCVCKFCESKFKYNAMRMKKHLVRDCSSCLAGVKLLFVDQVNNSSLALKSKNSSTIKLCNTNVNNEVDDCEITSQSSYFTRNINAKSDSDAETASDSNNKRVDNEHFAKCVNQKATSHLSPNHHAKVKVSCQPSILTFADTITADEQQNLNALFAKALYSSAMPFCMTENAQWLEFFKKLRPAWKPPTKYTLSEPLLKYWDAKINAENVDIMQKASALVLMMDGWSCCSGNNHIQFLCATPKPIYLKSVHPRSQSHTAEYIMQQISGILQDEEKLTNRKPEDFAAIVSDHASNMVSAWKLLQEKYSWLICYGCGAHALELLSKDLRNIHTVSLNLEEIMMVCRFFRNHQVPKAILEDMTLASLGRKLTCLTMVPTRWSSACAMTQRILEIRYCLQSCVTDLRLQKYLALDNKIIKQLILSDDGFWMRTLATAAILKPIKNAILELEGNECKLSVMPRIWKVLDKVLRDNVQGTQSPFSEEEKNMFFSSLSHRRSFSIQPVHFAAHLLDPRFLATDINETECGLGEKLILKMAHDRHLIESDIITDLMEFKAKDGSLFGRCHIWKNVDFDVDPLMWWKANGGTRSLAIVAKILFTFPSTTASVERANKQYSLQKTKLRNNLSDCKGAMLAKVAYNIKSQARHSMVRKASNSHQALIFPTTDIRSNVTKSCHVSNTLEMKRKKSMFMNNEVERNKIFRSVDIDSSDSDSSVDYSNISTSSTRRTSTKVKTEPVFQQDNLSNMSDCEFNESSSSSVTSLEAENELSDIALGDFVAVAIETTGSKAKHNCAKLFCGVVHGISAADVFEVKFLNEKYANHYNWPEKLEISEVDRSQVMKLSPPNYSCNTSSRKSGLSFSNYELSKARRNLIINRMK